MYKYTLFIITSPSGLWSLCSVIINMIYRTLRRVIINIFLERQNQCWCLLLLLPFCRHFREGIKHCFLVVCFDGRFYIWPQGAISDFKTVVYFDILYIYILHVYIHVVYMYIHVVYTCTCIIIYMCIHIYTCIYIYIYIYINKCM